MSCGLLQESIPEELPDVADVEEDVKEKEVGDEGEIQEEEDPYSDDLTISDEEHLGISEGWINLYETQLKKKIISPGVEGTNPEPHYLCCLNLVGCLKEGTEIDSQEPLVLQLGDAEVVLGIDLVLLSMTVGEKSLVEVSPALGYGTLGRAPDVPPNQVLIYLIELVSCEPEPPLISYTSEELKRVGVRKRERGNWWHNRNEYQLALTCYRRALDYLEPQNKSDLESEDLLLEDRLKVYNNMGSIFLKMEQYDMALNYIDQVLHCQPENVKALFRKGKILSAQGRPKDALQIFSKAVELEPTNSAVLSEMKVSQDALKSQGKQCNEFHKKSLGAEGDATATEGGRAEISVSGAGKSGDITSSMTGLSSGKSSEPKVKVYKPKKTSKSVSKLRRNPQSRIKWNLILIGTVAAVSVGFVAFRYKNHYL